ncbi:hypothetical protein ACLQ2T_17945 [Micromonospora sp. DT229]
MNKRGTPTGRSSSTTRRGGTENETSSATPANLWPLGPLLRLRDKSAILTSKGYEALADRETRNLYEAWPKISEKISSLKLNHLTSASLESHFKAFCVSAARRRAAFSRLRFIASSIAALMAVFLSLAVLAVAVAHSRPYAVVMHLLTALALTLPATYALRSRRLLPVFIALGMSLTTLVVALLVADRRGWFDWTALLPVARTADGDAAAGIALGAAFVATMTLVALGASGIEAVVSRTHQGISAPDIKAFEDLHEVIVGLLGKEKWSPGSGARRRIAKRLEVAAASVENMYRPYPKGSRWQRIQREELRKKVDQAAKVLREGRPLWGAPESDDKVVGDCIVSMIAICLGDHGKLPSSMPAVPPQRTARPVTWPFVRRFIAALIPVAVVLAAPRLGVPISTSFAAMLGGLAVLIALLTLFTLVHPEPGWVFAEVRRILGVVATALGTPPTASDDDGLGPEQPTQPPDTRQSTPKEQRPPEARSATPGSTATEPTDRTSPEEKT